MNELVEVFALVEGRTEQFFAKNLLAPLLINKNVQLVAALIGKPGAKGGNVKFSRAFNDLEKLFKQRKNTYITTIFDYYGIGTDWPGFEESLRKISTAGKNEIMCRYTVGKLREKLVETNIEQRFIPYFSMHEFEALLFSDASILAAALNVKPVEIQAILEKYASPEDINNSPQTAPSKRLEKFSRYFKKNVDGLKIAKKIGIPAIRKVCPLFDKWLGKLEELGEK